MKRDCGNGELVPIRWEVVHSLPYSDDEKITKFATREEAEKYFDEHTVEVANCESYRLYAADRKGYMNFIRSISKTVNGKTMKTDRRNEL